MTESPDHTGPEGRDAPDAVETPDAATTTKKARPHGKFRRRVAAVAALGVSLLAVGGLYAVFAPQPQTAQAQPDATLIARGAELYNQTCITCHGSNLQGVANRGPSLVGVGDAAVYFQVSSGRMPMARQEAQAIRKQPIAEFDPETPEGQANLEALGAYIQANGGGPQTPEQTGAQLIGTNPARGGQLFRLNCSSCHNFTGVGGALSSGKFAPALAPANEEQIYTAMLTGPQNMPRFSDQQLTPEEKKDIIAYVESVKEGGTNTGGYGLGDIGPTSEGIIIFIVGMAGLIGFAMWLGSEVLSTGTEDPGRSVASAGSEDTKGQGLSQEDLDGMSQEQLARLAGELDDVEVVHNTPKFPIPGTRAEKRAERSVALWFIISALSGLAFVVAFIFMPFEYASQGEPGYLESRLYTPVIGFTFGLAVLALGIAVIQYVKKLFPDEVAVQQRHDGASDEVARRTVLAQLADAGKNSTIGRRKFIQRSAGAAAGVFGLGVGVIAIGGLIKNPWAEGDDSALWHTGWRPENGETVYMRTDTGILTEIARVRPEDMEPGSMMTVFPFRESERGNEEELLHAQRASDAPVMLIRLRPGTQVTTRPGQENFNYGDFYAWSKVCTHLGCPTSLYQAQDNRILCPCHQSQFLATLDAEPVFGPAARPLPQLPITVNNEGYFVARSDFVEPVGPAFWERKKTT